MSDLAEGGNMFIFPQLSGAESVTNTSCLSLSYAGEHLIQEATHRIYAMRVHIESIKGGLETILVCIKHQYLLFKASALWAEAFYKSKFPYVCLYVCVFVCLFTFEVPFKHIFSPTS